MSDYLYMKWWQQTTGRKFCHYAWFIMFVLLVRVLTSAGRLASLLIHTSLKDWQMWTNSMRQSCLIKPIFMTFVIAALQGSSSSLSSGLVLNKKTRWNFKYFSRIASFIRRFWIRSQSCIRFLKEQSFNPSVSGGNHTYHQFSNQQFHVLPTQLYLCVLCGSENKQRLFPYTALTDWFL